MKIKAIQNFAHAPSRRSFAIGKEYEVSDKAGQEFVNAGLATEVKPEPETKKHKPSAGAE